MISPFGVLPPPQLFFFCCGFILPCCSCFNYSFIFPNIFFIFLILFCFLFFHIVLLLFSFAFFWPHHTACETSVPRPEIGPKLLWWELQVQTAGLTENLRPQGILIRVRRPGGPYLSTKIWLYPTACKLQCWMPKAKQPVRQKYSLTHQK